VSGDFTRLGEAGAGPRIVILDDWERAYPRLADWRDLQSHAQIDIHHQPLRGQALHAVLQSAQVLVLTRDRTPVDRALLTQAPALRCIVFTGTRNNTLDAAAVHEAGITLGHTAWGPSKDSTCELTWTLILAAAKQLPAHQARLLAGQWRPTESLPLLPTLHGQTLGLIGLGEIGGRVARVGQALGMEVITWSPRMTEARAAEKGARFVPLDELLERARVVSLHLVPTDATRGLLNRERLARMRADSVLVNTSRSALIDTPALVEALRAGRPAMAALDVFDEEPLPMDHALRALPNVLLTPHLGFVSEEVFSRFAQGILASLTAWVGGQELPMRLLPD
jgi:phosphoglycerate dehydrogenase-like enzyme